MEKPKRTRETDHGRTRRGRRTLSHDLVDPTFVLVDEQIPHLFGGRFVAGGRETVRMTGDAELQPVANQRVPGVVVVGLPGRFGRAADEIAPSPRHGALNVRAENDDTAITVYP